MEAESDHQRESEARDEPKESSGLVLGFRRPFAVAWPVYALLISMSVTVALVVWPPAWAGAILASSLVSAWFTWMCFRRKLL